MKKMDFMKLIGIAIFGLSLSVPADEGVWAADPPRFKGMADLPDAVQLVTGFSDDGQAVTVLFRNLDAALDGHRGPSVNTRAVTVALPIANESQEVSVTQDIRGYVDVDESARAVLVVNAGGKTTVVDLKQQKDKGKEGYEKEGSKESVSQARERAEKQFGDEPEKEPVGMDIHTRLEGVVPAGAPYQVSFWLLVERSGSDPEAGGLLVIDSLDVTIAAKSSSE